MSRAGSATQNGTSNSKETADGTSDSKETGDGTSNAKETADGLKEGKLPGRPEGSKVLPNPTREEAAAPLRRSSRSTAGKHSNPYHLPRSAIPSAETLEIDVELSYRERAERRKDLLANGFVQMANAMAGYAQVANTVLAENTFD